MIEIVNGKTHEFKQFENAQAIADFLHGRKDAKHWTGHEPHGELPAPSEHATRNADEAPAASQEVGNASVTDPLAVRPAAKVRDKAKVKAKAKAAPAAPAKKSARRK